MTPLEAAVVRTVTWFDLFSHPVTMFECWQYLYQEGEFVGTVTPWQVRNCLRELQGQGALTQRLGFWQLASSPDHLPSRQQRARWAILKRKRALAGARLISYLPFVRLVALVNSVALESPRQATSDVDLFIVAARGRLFLVRLFVTLATHLRGWRRHGDYAANRLCLSFYLSEDALSLAPFALADDPYLHFWLASLVPLVDRGAYRTFLAANAWATVRLPHWQLVAQAYPARLISSAPTASFCQRLLERLGGGRWGDAWERLFRQLELKRIVPYVGGHLNDGTGDVVITDQVVKMHVTDRRRALAQAFRQRLAPGVARVV